jgi:hypothetical protein
MTNPDSPQNGGVPQAPAKKISPLVWILGGIAVFILLLGGAAIIGTIGTYFLVSKAKQAGLDPDLMEQNPGLAVAKMMAAMNPEIDVVSVDDKKGVITFKEKSTGKTVTVNFEDAKQGKIRFTGDNDEEVTVETDSESGVTQLKSADGSFQMGGIVKLPSWVPAYPGANPQGTYSTQAKDSDSASIHFSTRDPLDQVAKFYESGLKGSGLKVTVNILQQDGKPASGMIGAQDDANLRNVVVTLSASNERTAVHVAFTEKK